MFTDPYPGVTYIVPCGGAKLDRSAPAAELYTGSMFRHTLDNVRREVEQLMASEDAPPCARILILSAQYGLVELDEVLAPYDLKMGQRGSVPVDVLQVQALALGIGWSADGLTPCGDVYTFLPKAYYARLREALVALDVYPSDGYGDSGAAGIGLQKRVNVQVGRQYSGQPAPVTVEDRPGPKVWIGGDVSAFWWGVPLLVSYGRLRDARTLPVATAPWVLDSRGFNEINDHGRWTIDQAQYIADCRRYRDEIGMLQWVAPQDWPAGAHLLARTGLSETEHQDRTIASVVGMRTAAPDLDVITVLTAKNAAGYLRHIDMYARAGIDLRAEQLPIGVGALVGRPPSEAADIIRVLHAAGLRRLHGFGVKGEVLDLVGDLIDSFDSADWSGVIRRAFRRGGALDLCPHGLVKYERNCPRAAVAWSQEQAERAGRALIQQSLPLFDIPV